jgi:hypothetical protein
MEKGYDVDHYSLNKLIELYRKENKWTIILQAD